MRLFIAIIWLILAANGFTALVFDAKDRLSAKWQGNPPITVRVVFILIVLLTLAVLLLVTGAAYNYPD